MTSYRPRNVATWRSITSAVGPHQIRKAHLVLWFLMAAAATQLQAQSVRTGPKLERTLPGAMRETKCAAFSPDGKWLAAAGAGLRSGEVKLFDVQSGEEKLQLQLARPPVTVAFSPDGARLAAAYPSSASGHALKVWEIEGAKESYELDSIYGPHAWDFDSTAAQIATWNADRTVTIWDAASGDEVFSFEPEGWKREFEMLRWRPQSQEIAAAEPSNPGWVHFWGAKDGQPIRKINTGETGASSFAFSGDGSKLVGDVYREGIVVWDVESGRPRTKTPYWRVKFSSHVAVSPNGKLIALRGASANNDKSGPIKVWSGDSGKELFEIKDRAPTSVTFSPDSSLLAGVAGRDGVMIYRVADPDPAFRAPAAATPVAPTHRDVTKNPAPAPKTARPAGSVPDPGDPASPKVALPSTAAIVPQPLVLKAHPDPAPGESANEKRAIINLALSPDQTKLASVNGRGEVNLWDLTTGEMTRLATEGESTSVQFTSDGALLLAGNGTRVSAWEVATAAGKASFGDGSGSSFGWYVAPDGLTLATLDYPGNGVRRIRFWSTAAPESPLLTLDLEDNPECLALARGGALAAMQLKGSEEGVRLIDLKAKAEIAPIRGLPFKPSALTFHPNGKVLATVSSGGELQFWDVSKSPARLVGKQESEWSYPGSIFFSDDGSYLVLPDREVQLWRVASRTLQAPIAGLRERVALSADGKTIVGLTSDHTTVVADSDTGQIRTALEVALPNGEPAYKWGASGAYAVSRDGGFVAIGTKSGSVEVRPLVADRDASKAVIFPLKVPQMLAADGLGTLLPQVGFSADGKYVVYRQEKWTAIGELASNKIWFPAVPTEPRSPPKALQLAGYFFHPTNRTLFALAGGQSSLWKYNIDSGRVAREAASRRQYHALEISPDQKLVAAVVTPPAKPLQLVLIDPVNGQLVGEPLLADAKDQLGTPSSAQFGFSSDSRRLAVLLDRKIRVWDLETRRELLLNTTGDWQSIYLIEDGAVLAAVDRVQNRLKLFDLESTQIKSEIELKRFHTGEILDVAVSPVDPIFASVGENGEVLLRDLASGDLLARFTGHQGNVDSVAFAPDGKTLATAEVANAPRNRPEQGELRLWTIDLDALAKNNPAKNPSAPKAGASAQHVE